MFRRWYRVELVRAEKPPVGWVCDTVEEAFSICRVAVCGENPIAMVWVCDTSDGRTMVGYRTPCIAIFYVVEDSLLPGVYRQRANGDSDMECPIGSDAERRELLQGFDSLMLSV